MDNIFPHHEDEIAQSEAAFGSQHVRYWVHAQHLLADGAKMAKSSGNVFLIEELIERGFDPLSFRYLCMNVLYRHRMNFTFTSLRAAEKALTNLRRRVWLWSGKPRSRPTDRATPGARAPSNSADGSGMPWTLIWTFPARWPSPGKWPGPSYPPATSWR